MVAMPDDTDIDWDNDTISVILSNPITKEPCTVGDTLNHYTSMSPDNPVHEPLGGLVQRLLEAMAQGVITESDYAAIVVEAGSDEARIFAIEKP